MPIEQPSPPPTGVPEIIDSPPPDIQPIPPPDIPPPDPDVFPDPLRDRPQPVPRPM
jgi:hypothetical protein